MSAEDQVPRYVKIIFYYIDRIIFGSLLIIMCKIFIKSWSDVIVMIVLMSIVSFVFMGIELINCLRDDNDDRDY